MEPGRVTTMAFRFLESGLARLVWLLTAGPASFFVTGVTLPVVGPTGRDQSYVSTWDPSFRR